jgi:hypothetical protein
MDAPPLLAGAVQVSFTPCDPFGAMDAVRFRGALGAVGAVLLDELLLEELLLLELLDDEEMLLDDEELLLEELLLEELLLDEVVADELLLDDIVLDELLELPLEEPAIAVRSRARL